MTLDVDRIRSSFPALEQGVAYFDGEQGPRVDTRTGWDVLGLEVRTVLDFGAGAIGWRGAYRSNGQ